MPEKSPSLVEQFFGKFLKRNPSSAEVHEGHIEEAREQLKKSKAAKVLGDDLAVQIALAKAQLESAELSVMHGHYRGQKLIEDVKKEIAELEEKARKQKE